MWAIRIYTLIIATSLISIATFASLLFNTLTVEANGVGTTHLQDEAVGPYLVTLKTSPAQLTVGTIRASLHGFSVCGQRGQAAPRLSPQNRLGRLLC